MQGPIAKPILDVYLVGKSTVSAFSLSQRERLCRSLIGVVEFTFHETLQEPCGGPNVLVVRDDWVIEKKVLQGLISGVSTILNAATSEQPMCVAAYVPIEQMQAASQLIVEQSKKIPDSLRSIRLANSAEISGSFEGELRKRGAPLVVKITEETRDDVERQLFQSSYKGATDFITKFFWPKPALLAVRVLAKYGVTPNVITALSLICVVATFLLFWNGAFWWGILSAYIMAFLDTVDGKLARVTLTTTRVGHLLDHGIDLISPPFWWGAWFAGLLGSNFASANDFQNWGWLSFWTIMANYWLVRGVEAWFVKKFGFNIHIWRPADFAFRLVTTRRNVNVTILAGGLLIGRPDVGFLGVALWSLASLIYHAFRFCQAQMRMYQKERVESFLS